MEKKEKILCEWTKEYDEVILKANVKGEIQYIPLLKYSGKRGK